MLDQINNISLIVGILGLALTGYGALISYNARKEARHANKDKAKLENLINHKLSGFIINVNNIVKYPIHADGEIQRLHEHAKKLPESEHKEKILFFAHMSGRDIEASKGMVENLLVEIQSFQDGLVEK